MQSPSQAPPAASTSEHERQHHETQADDAGGASTLLQHVSAGSSSLAAAAVPTAGHGESAGPAILMIPDAIRLPVMGPGGGAAVIPTVAQAQQHIRPPMVSSLHDEAAHQPSPPEVNVVLRARQMVESR